MKMRPVLLVVVMVAQASCRLLGGGDPPAELRAATATLPDTIDSVATWDRLDADARVEVLGGQHARYPNLVMAPRQEGTKYADPAAAKLVERMAAYLRQSGDMEIGDSLHARVGALKVTASILSLKGAAGDGGGAGPILGGVVWFWHQGCDMPDETTPSFKDQAEAEVAGCEGGPGSYWAAHGSFNHDGTPFEYSDFMEWGAAE